MNEKNSANIVLKRKSEEPFENEKKKIMASSEEEDTTVKVETVKEEPEDTENWAEQRIRTPLFVERCTKQPPVAEIKREPLNLKTNEDNEERFLNFTYGGIWTQESSESIDEEEPIRNVKIELFEETETCVQYSTETTKPSESTSRKDLRKLRKKRQNMFGNCFRTKEQDMIINVHRYIEKTLPKDQYPYKTLLCAKTASILGISTTTVHKIMKLASNGACKYTSTSIPKPQFSDKIDELTNNAMRKKVHIFYMKGEIPTTNNIFHAINNDENLPNFKMATFKRMLKHLKIKTVKNRTHYPLIDAEDVILSRVNYLKKIKEYRRQKRCIYYLDEMWLYAENTARSKKNANTENTCMVIAHIGNEHGFVDGGLGVFFSDASPHRRKKIDAHQFEEWFEQILPKLEKNALVVMDDAPYHSRMHGKTPTIGWPKKDIQNWLRNKGVNYAEDNLKFELLDRTKKVSKHHLYAVDEMAKRSNIEVLRLPPYHYELNPIKVIWADIKAIVPKYTTLNTDNLRKLVDNVIENRLSIEKWRASVQEVVDLEDNFYCKIDAVMDDAIDRYLDHNVTNPHSSEESTVACDSSDSETEWKL